MTTSLDAPIAPEQRKSQEQRVNAFVSDAMQAVRDVMLKHDMTYAEYDTVKQWLISVGEAGEWPLFLDVWFESTVEQLATRRRAGSKGTILGPFYLPNQAELATPATLPMRENEKGDRLVFSGAVQSAGGGPLGDAVLDIWQADADGLYSGFGADADAGNLRARVHTDDQGHFEIHTVVPAPYEIPKEGPCGKLLAAAGWSAFRPAHLHVRVTAPGHEELISQLYFAGGEYVGNDVASAVKDELIVTLADSDGGKSASYVFELAPVG